VLTGTILEQYETNIAFHLELLGLCSNRELVNLVTELRSRTSSAPAGQWRTRARVEQSGREHHEMVEALAGGDAGRLKQIITLHIRQPQTPAQAGTGWIGERHGADSAPAPARDTIRDQP
jgi:DNA-binding GntR family transcriptional regulator